MPVVLRDAYTISAVQTIRWMLTYCMHIQGILQLCKFKKLFWLWTTIHYYISVCTTKGHMEKNTPGCALVNLATFPYVQVTVLR